MFSFSELVFPEFRMAERPHQDLYMWPDSIEQVCIFFCYYLTFLDCLLYLYLVDITRRRFSAF